MYRAVVFGSTGAVGRDVVRELVKSSKCEEVVALTRRPVQPSVWLGGGEDGDEASSPPSKLNIQQVDVTNASTYTPLLSGKSGGSPAPAPTVVFYTLGTTRKDAGSAKKFVEIDLGYLESASAAAKEAAVEGFSLLSSRGASAGAFYSLYLKTKGRGEEEVKKQHFPLTSVFRPGLLDRGEDARGVEKLGMMLMSSLPVASVGRAMVRDMEDKVAAAAAGGGGGGGEGEGGGAEAKGGAAAEAEPQGAPGDAAATVSTFDVKDIKALAGPNAEGRPRIF